MLISIKKVLLVAICIFFAVQQNGRAKSNRKEAVSVTPSNISSKPPAEEAYLSVKAEIERGNGGVVYLKFTIANTGDQPMILGSNSLPWNSNGLILRLISVENHTDLKRGGSPCGPNGLVDGVTEIPGRGTVSGKLDLTDIAGSLSATLETSDVVVFWCSAPRFHRDHRDKSPDVTVEHAKYGVAYINKNR